METKQVTSTDVLKAVVGPTFYWNLKKEVKPLRLLSAVAVGLAVFAFSKKASKS